MSATFPTYGDLAPLSHEIYEEVKTALEKLDINFIVSYGGGMHTVYIPVERPSQLNEAQGGAA